MPHLPKDKIAVMIYPTLELKKAAMDEAKRDHRSLNAFILVAIEEALKSREKKRGK